jgi:hypothetical protein
LSAGRNAGLGAVKTKYFVLMDDDMRILPTTDLHAMFLKIKETDVDILGAQVQRPGGIAHVKCGSLSMKGDCLELKLGDSHSCDGDFLMCDYVENFFIAKTDVVRRMGGWAAELKVIEHWEFFWRAKHSGVQVGYLLGYAILDDTVRTAAYDKYRGRRSEFGPKALDLVGAGWFRAYVNKNRRWVASWTIKK